jgi:hypothetical protein
MIYAQSQLYLPQKEDVELLMFYASSREVSGDALHRGLCAMYSNGVII